MKRFAPAVASLALMVSSLAQADQITVALRPEALAPMLTREEVRMGAPALASDTQGPRLGERWKRPELSPRDRRSVTVSALSASGHVAPIPSHRNRARAPGLTPAQASEGLTHAAVYAGWPNVVSAVPVVKAVLENRPRSRASGRHAAPLAAGSRSASSQRLGQVFRHGTAERRAARRSAVRVMAIREAVDAECSGAFGSCACHGGVPCGARRVCSPWVPRRSRLP
jgi:alkylhydroperoxidase/carboxymuconolactone decarboxylase family protein YurZ